MDSIPLSQKIAYNTKSKQCTIPTQQNIHIYHHKMGYVMFIEHYRILKD
jgi:hypothetical protein